MPIIYFSQGDLQINYTANSFNGIGKVAILQSNAPSPSNNGLVRFGDVWSLGFSNNVGAVEDLVHAIYN